MTVYRPLRDADSVATESTSELTFAHILEHVDEVVTVTDEEIATGIVVLLERAKQLVEGAGTTPVAALTSSKLDVTGETVVPILSGGNLDTSMLKTILTHELTSRSQMIRLHVCIDDRPGQLSVISDRIADRGANIRTVHHIRTDDSLSTYDSVRFRDGRVDAVENESGVDIDRLQAVLNDDAVRKSDRTSPPDPSGETPSAHRALAFRDVRSR